MSVKSCAITGHRPTRFKFGYKENYTGCKRLKKRLYEQFALLYEKGVRRFYVGGSLGVDMWAGEQVLTLKEQKKDGKSPKKVFKMSDCRTRRLSGKLY